MGEAAAAWATLAVVAGTDDGGTDPTAAPDAVASTIDAAEAVTLPARAAASSGARTGPRSGRVTDGLRGLTLDRLREVSRDQYDVGDELARGGLGRILRATDQRTGRPVAIKEVLRSSSSLTLRFAREALVTANLQHPSIVPVYEVGRWPDGEPFFAMKLVRGRSLEELVAATSTAAARLPLLPHVIDVADALAYAHGERIIHRDLKPANVLVGDYGETVVIDWGLAKNLATGEEGAALPTPGAFDATGDSGETMAGSVMGTPAYMPPEQARGELVDERADVYAIGAMLYHVLGGAPPYGELRGAEAVLAAVIDGPPRPLAALAPELPDALVAIVVKAMASDPAARYPTAAELAQDLRRFVGGQLVMAHRYTTRERLARWFRAHRAIVTTTAIALVALGVFAGFSVRRITAERDEAARQRGEAERQRGEAERQRVVAEQRFGEGLEELGRQALIDHQPARALPLLAGALQSIPAPGPVTRLLAQRAADAYAGLIATAPGPGGDASAELTATGLIVTSGATAQLTAWDPAANAARWQVAGPTRALLSPDGTRVAALDDAGALTFHDATTGHRDPAFAAPLPAGAPVESWAWSRDGRAVALGRVDGTLLVVTPAGVVVRPGAHRGAIHAVAWSIDGRELLSGGEDHLVGRWSADLTPRAVLRGHARAVWDVRWLDGGRAVSSDASDPQSPSAGVAILWDVARGAVVRRFDDGASLWGAVVDPAARLLVTHGAYTTTAKVWDLATGALRATLPEHAGGIPMARFVALDDGVVVVTADESGVVRLWDPPTGTLLGRLPTVGEPSALTGRDGRIVLAGPTGGVEVWDLATTVRLRRLVGPVGRIRHATFDASGATIYVASNDGTASAFDVATGRRRWTVGSRTPVPDAPDGAPAESPAGMRWIEVSPDGTSVVTAATDGTVATWDASTGAPRGAFVGHRGRVRVAHFDTTGAALLTAGIDGTVRIWDVATGRQRRQLDVGAPVYDARWRAADIVTMTDDPDGNVGPAASTLAIWDAATGAPRPIADAARTIRLPALAVDPEGRVYAGAGDALEAFELGGAAASYTLPRARTFALDFAHHTPWIVTGSISGDLAIDRRTDGGEVAAWRAADTLISAVQIRHDDAVIATLSLTDPNATSVAQVRLWDPSTLRLLAETPPLDTIATELWFSPDGNRLLVGGSNGLLLVWSVASWTGDGAALAARAAAVSPWRLEGSSLRAASTR